MESLQLKATVFIILATFPINGQITCGRRLIHHEGLITNGFSTKEGDWPWSAAIYHFSAKDLQYKCGGSVLTSNTILTAAHCVFENNRLIISQRVIVHLGKHNLKISGTNVQDFQAHEVIPHPSYNITDLSNDIAIIRLSTEATFNNYVQPLCLWDENKVSVSEVTNKFGIVIGFGATETDEISVILKQAVMPVVSFATCLGSNRDFFGSYLSDKNFCAGFRNGTSVCNGDSGGSMTFKENDVYRIRGIVSLTVSREDKRLCNSNEYVIFTDVAQYLTWIKDLVPQLNTSPIAHNSGHLNFVHSGNVRWASSCDYNGGDIANEKSRAEECGGLCTINKRCTHFTWTEEEHKCLMKQFEVDATATVLRDYEYNTICGSIVRPAKGLYFQIDGNGRWSHNCDFSGGDIDSEKSSPAQCGVLCENRKDCTHFSWTSYDGGTCWLKGTGVNPSAYYTHNENGLCGWIVRDSEWNFAGIPGHLNFVHSGNVRWASSCDYNGGDIANEKSRAEECGGLCTINKRCTHFTWTEEEHKCLMKQFEVDATATVLRDYEYNTICGSIVRPAKGLYFQIDGNGRWSHNCDFSGGDIDSEKSSPAQCGVLCENRKDCTHFTWTSYDGGTCWLKGTGVNPSAYYTHNENALCGWIVRDSEWNFAGRVGWNFKCDFLGDDIKMQKSTAEMCGGLCNDLNDCHHFTWTSFNGGTCWLKGNQVNRQTKKNDEESICGWVKKNI